MAPEDTEGRDAHFFISPGIPGADVLRRWWGRYNPLVAETEALKDRQRGEELDQRKEGVRPEINDRDFLDNDAEIDGSESDEFGFSRALIKTAIGEAVAFFTNDSKIFHGESGGAIRNAAVLSVGMGVILAPRYARRGMTPEEILRLGRLEGQRAVDDVAQSHEDFINDMRRGQVSAKDEDELFVIVSKGGKISDSDKKRLSAFLEANRLVAVVSVPNNSCAPGAAHDSGGTLSFFTSVVSAKRYFLRMIGCDATPKQKLHKDNELGTQPPRLIGEVPVPPAS